MNYVPKGRRPSQSHIVYTKEEERRDESCFPWNVMNREYFVRLYSLSVSACCVYLDLIKTVQARN